MIKTVQTYLTGWCPKNLEKGVKFEVFVSNFFFFLIQLVLKSWFEFILKLFSFFIGKWDLYLTQLVATSPSSSELKRVADYGLIRGQQNFLCLLKEKLSVPLISQIYTRFQDVIQFYSLCEISCSDPFRLFKVSDSGTQCHRQLLVLIKHFLNPLWNRILILFFSKLG